MNLEQSLNTLRGAEEPMRLTFQKSGRDIKHALQKRRAQLQERLARRNAALDTFLNDRAKVRSFLVRSAETNYGHSTRGATLYGVNEISSEEKEEVTQLCERIFALEQELAKLALIEAHLSDDKTFDLTFEELISYGFEAQPPSGA
jgi:multidrug efflux pump subunit AcrA (membrane-fusion protein)